MRYLFFIFVLVGCTSQYGVLERQVKIENVCHRFAKLVTGPIYQDEFNKCKKEQTDRELEIKKIQAKIPQSIRGKVTVPEYYPSGRCALYIYHTQHPPGEYPTEESFFNLCMSFKAELDLL